MAWTTPTIRATGYLVTASDWNTDIVNNLAYLKGQAGNVEYEDDIVPDSGSEKVGLSTAPWDEGHYDKLFAGPRCALHKFIREITIDWMDDSWGDYQMDDGLAGSGSVNMGGVGQVVLEVNDSAVGSSYIYQRPEQSSALDVSFNVSRSPYFKYEFSVSRKDANAGMFFGLRQTVGAALPDPAAEKFAGFRWDGTDFKFMNGDGAGNSELSAAQTINVDTRYVIEILITSATNVEYYLNGVLVKTTTTGLPTGDLDFTWLLETDGGGGGTQSFLTVGKAVIQEDLS